ncbi:hypothetical protein Patl1_07212 [Pistacia atlantica]|uniref:Uncharacterized protein n=1 Tax=Pistacia atlantica TaxID=434234 RepID=A0ACC1AGI9_9ROSI|nr:hypothetical protein Patl1_07212 [Pistacia atlantica]
MFFLNTSKLFLFLRNMARGFIMRFVLYILTQ